MNGFPSARLAGRGASHLPDLSCDAVVARQPVYDSALRIHGYELLYRAADPLTVNGNVATATVLLDAFHVGAANLAPDQRLYVNCTREFLMTDPVLPPQSCVLEILETALIDEALLRRMQELKKAGYRLALDDFLLSEPGLRAVELADYVKVDVLQYDLHGLCNVVSKLKSYATVLLAEKVENECQFALCKSLGFRLYQGYYLRRPDLLSAKRIRTRHMAALRLLIACQHVDVSLHELERIVSSDASLTYNLLCMANSAVYGARGPISSIHEAICRIGTEQLMRWAMPLMLVSDPEVPTGYAEVALQRACMCHRMAVEMEAISAASYFLAGILSAMDSLIGVSLETVVHEVGVTDQIREAVLLRAGLIGSVLDAVLAWEAGDWGAAERCGFAPRLMRRAYAAALAESAEMMSVCARRGNA